MSYEVIFGVYDSHKHFLGYKSDSSWDLTLNRGRAKTHPGDCSGHDSHLIRNLVSFLNGCFNGDKPLDKPYKCGEFDLQKTLFVIPETAEGNQHLPEIKINRSSGHYAVVPKE